MSTPEQLFVVKTRLKPELRARLQERARAQGISVAELMRRMVARGMREAVVEECAAGGLGEFRAIIREELAAIVGKRVIPLIVRAGREAGTGADIGMRLLDALSRSDIISPPGGQGRNEWLHQVWQESQGRAMKRLWSREEDVARGQG